MAFGDDVLPVDGAVPIAKQSKLKARAAIAHSLNASIKRALALYRYGQVYLVGAPILAVELVSLGAGR